MVAGTPGTRAEVRVVEIGPDQAGQRIDNYLIARLKGVPRSRVYRILRRGEVRVNRGRVSAAYRLRAGDAVRIPPVTLAATPQTPARSALPGRLEAAILYEDDGLLVLDKPSGVAAHGGSGIALGAIEALRAARPDAPFLELVHRLDRETSGCMMVAKKRSVLRDLHARLRDHAVDKRYLLLVRGAWRGGGRRVELALARDRLRGGERVVRVAADGQPARTAFTPVEVYSTASLLQARPASGRTHQIRVHAAAVGHPIAGDTKYGDPQFNRDLRELGLRRLFLHAAALVLERPGGERLEVEAPLPAALRSVLDELGADAAV
ncbi:MAG: 23S rRNA pseudouridine(955/2504/2580) synthase RluC [Gammaproteobacteria bacterium]|nr:23S rRNA pseudouridine(955/2504/2580) synthase RluC [Gammaproteobacteria bacterium]